MTMSSAMARRSSYQGSGTTAAGGRGGAPSRRSGSSSALRSRRLAGLLLLALLCIGLIAAALKATNQLGTVGGEGLPQLLRGAPPPGPTATASERIAAPEVVVEPTKSEAPAADGGAPGAAEPAAGGDAGAAGPGPETKGAGEEPAAPLTNRNANAVAVPTVHKDAKVEGAAPASELSRGGGGSGSSSTGSGGGGTVLLVVASSGRPDYLRRCLEHVIKYHPKDSTPVVVSEDGQSPQVAKVVSEAAAAFAAAGGAMVPLLHWHHPGAARPAENGYFRLSRHFKWALDQVFGYAWPEGADAGSGSTAPCRRVIILEEDLEVASDFFVYFRALERLLDEDASLLAVSAWNDNGLHKFVRDPRQLYRSDFFPGLGWMLPRRVWEGDAGVAEGLGPKWPEAYWDDWLREPQQRRGRHIIRPEVSRTYHFGKRGVSNAQYHEFTDDIKLNEEFVNFESLDLSYLKKDEWDRTYLDQVARAVPLRDVSALRGLPPGTREVRIAYKSLDARFDSFVSIANGIGIMDNIKAGVPRTAYRGIVSTWLQLNGGGGGGGGGGEWVRVHVYPQDLRLPETPAAAS